MERDTSDNTTKIVSSHANIVATDNIGDESGVVQDFGEGSISTVDEAGPNHEDQVQASILEALVNETRNDNGLEEQQEQEKEGSLSGSWSAEFMAAEQARLQAEEERLREEEERIRAEEERVRDAEQERLVQELQEERARVDRELAEQIQAQADAQEDFFEEAERLRLEEEASYKAEEKSIVPVEETLAQAEVAAIEEPTVSAAMTRAVTVEPEADVEPVARVGLEPVPSNPDDETSTEKGTEEDQSSPAAERWKRATNALRSSLKGSRKSKIDKSTRVSFDPSGPSKETYVPIPWSEYEPEPRNSDDEMDDFYGGSDRLDNWLSQQQNTSRRERSVRGSADAKSLASLTGLPPLKSL